MLQGSSYKVRGYTQLAPNGTVAFLHRSFITKYDPTSDEGRPCSHLTVELTGVWDMPADTSLVEGGGNRGICKHLLFTSWWLVGETGNVSERLIGLDASGALCACLMC